MSPIRITFSPHVCSIEFGLLKERTCKERKNEIKKEDRMRVVRHFVQLVANSVIKKKLIFY